RLVIEHYDALGSNTKKRLRRLPVLLRDGSVGPADEAYLSAAYAPAYPLEDAAALLGAGPFVSDAYLDGERPASEWKKFFVSLGVRSHTPLGVLRRLVAPLIRRGDPLGEEDSLALAQLTRELLGQVDGLEAD